MDLIPRITMKQWGWTPINSHPIAGKRWARGLPEPSQWRTNVIQLVKKKFFLIMLNIRILRIYLYMMSSSELGSS